MVGSGPFPDASTCTSLRMNPMATEGYAGYRISFDNVEFSASWPCRRGFGGHGRPDCVELVEGYAPVASAVDSTGLSLRVAASVIRSLQDNLLADSIETGVSTTDSTM